MACKHGFHDERVSVEHMLMFVLTEIAEAVEADRKWKHAQYDIFVRETSKNEGTEHWMTCFKIFIKDTVEDELADICIRLYDLCGEMCLEPIVEYSTMESHFQEIFGEDSFCERMYYLSRLILSTNGSPLNDGTDECLSFVVGSALSFLFALARSMHINLMRHIRLKMEFNADRTAKHGKKY